MDIGLSLSDALLGLCAVGHYQGFATHERGVHLTGALRCVKSKHLARSWRPSAFAGPCGNGNGLSTVRDHDPLLTIV